MKKPAIILQSGVISFSKLIDLIKSKDNTFAPMGSGGWEIRVAQTDSQNNEAILLFTACDCAPAPRGIIGVKETTIFTTSMIEWFSSLLSSSGLGFTFRPEEEVPSSLAKSIQSVINQSKK